MSRTRLAVPVHGNETTLADIVASSLQLPFNSLLVLQRTTALWKDSRRASVEKFLDLCCQASDILSFGTEALLGEGSHCYGLCTHVVQSLQDYFPTVPTYL